MLSVFGDESHDETNSRVFAVAGLFGSAEQWQVLDLQWTARTEGRIFHASDCENDMGDFAGTGHAENQRLYKELTQLLCRSKLLGFGAAVDLAGYREFFPDSPEDVPYYKCFRAVVTRCAKWASWSIPQDIVEFIFDQRPESNYSAGLLYTYMANQPEWKYILHPDMLSFGTRKRVGIQAADLLARETMKHFDNMIGPIKRPMRRSMHALSEAKRFGFDFYMREHFQEFKRQYNDLCKANGMDVEDYKEWLTEHSCDDSISSRHRYLIINIDRREKGSGNREP